MRISLLAVAAAFALPAVVLPSAYAADPSFGCGIDAMEEPDPSTPNAMAVGILHGGPWRSATPTNAVTITCRIDVNGVTVQTSPTGSGIGAARTSDVAAFNAQEDEVVAICTRITDGTTVIERCFDPIVTVVNGLSRYHMAPPRM